MSPSLRGILDGSDRSPRAVLIRAGLVPLEWLHRVGLEAYLLPYNTGLRRRHRLPVPVVAIGNLVSGGTGKTPMAIAVARLLVGMGQRVVVLSRGHGGSHERSGGALVVSDGSGTGMASPDAAGDEPVLIARALPGVPVVVGRDRRITGQLAVERFSPDVVVLDDALQFWQLHRDLDICLLDTSRPLDNGHMLPRGLLREPVTHLRRAGVVVLTRHSRAGAAGQAAARQLVERHAPGSLLLTGDHVPVGWATPDNDILMVDAIRGKRVRVVAGIADGQAFAESVSRLGAHVVDAQVHPDHHVYTDDDIVAAAASGVDFVAVTEKDWVKLAGRWPAVAPPAWALRISMELEPLAALEQRLRPLLSPTSNS